MSDEPNQIKPRTKTRFGFNKLKHRLNKKNFTYLICAAISIISIIIIVIVVVISLGHGTINDDYFISDDTKSVISLESSRPSSENDSFAKTHIVYTYDGDTITSLKTYFEYNSPEAAQAALNTIKTNPDFANAEVDGKYIIVTSDPKQYEGLTVSDIKQQAAAIKHMQEANKATQNQQETQQEEQPQEEQPQEAPQE
ncbi:hypothetical protein IKF21_01260 [Candidatus Saccharibacteria bacterium]|nr:hypothetical protein [Candidatus Saccharibacteria bacterium]